MKFGPRHAYLINLSQKPYGSIAAVLHDTEACRELIADGMIDEIGDVTSKGKSALTYYIDNGPYETTNGLVIK